MNVIAVYTLRSLHELTTGLGRLDLLFNYFIGGRVIQVEYYGFDLDISRQVQLGLHGRLLHMVHDAIGIL